METSCNRKTPKQSRPDLHLGTAGLRTVALAGNSAFLLGALLLATSASTLLLIAADSPGKANDVEIDPSIKPGDDFYGYANGGWLRTITIPAGHASYDTRAVVRDKTSRRVQDLIEEAAALQPINGGVAQKVGDYYAGFMDEDAIEAKGLTPLGDELARISAIADKTSLSAYLGTTLTGEVDGLMRTLTTFSVCGSTRALRTLSTKCCPPVARRHGDARSRLLFPTHHLK